MKHFWSLLAAYGLAWAVFFGYFFHLARRVQRLEDELGRLRQRQQTQPPPPTD